MSLKEFWKPLGRAGIFPEIFIFTGFYELSDEYVETEYLWTSVGISDSNHSGILLNRIRKTGIKKKMQLLIYAPNFISVIVLCGMVRMFLSPVGPLNKVCWE